MKKVAFVLFLLTSFVSLHAQTASVSSPDGKLCVSVKVDAGNASYSISYDGRQALLDSPLGFTATMGDFSHGLAYVSSQQGQQAISYDMTRAKKSHIEKQANTLVVRLRNQQQREYDVRFCVTDNDVAMRYEIAPVPDKTYEQKMSIRITSEATGFHMPEGTTTFLTPQSKAMIGWKGTKPSYEEEYKLDADMTEPSQFGCGYTFPCLFKAGDVWMLISETGVDSHYCASRLSEYKGNGLYTIDFPMAEENNGNGTIEPSFALPGHTPWRTITVGTTLKPIVETTVPWDYVEPLYETNNRYVYGKGTWSWIVWQDASINYDDQVKYIDLAKAMNYKYVLIDNWWDTNIGREGIERLVKYAHSQGIDVFLWHSSSGYWNDIVQGPINMMDNTIARKKEMRWLKQIGIKGIKVDFFGGDKQETMRLYEDILSDAEDNGLMVIFHGCTLPRGWERMYPNFVGAEAVLASENLFFSQHFCDVEAQNTATHPFIRNTVACMEFGGSFMNRVLGRDNQKGNIRRTTDCHELAQAVMFQNAIQNFALTPENLTSAPKISMDFMRMVPTEWDDIQFIDGYPGKYCILARRHADSWYIAGNNATGQTMTKTLSLPMLSKGDVVTIYADNLKDGEPTMKQIKIKDPMKVKVTMLNNGGFVIVK